MIISEKVFDLALSFVSEFEIKPNIRKVLLQEPRGYPCQNLNVIYPSANPEAEFGYIILEQGKIYPLFSGRSQILLLI